MILELKPQLIEASLADYPIIQIYVAILYLQVGSLLWLN